MGARIGPDPGPPYQASSLGTLGLYVAVFTGIYGFREASERPIVQSGQNRQGVFMPEDAVATMRAELETQKRVLEERLGRIKANVRRGFDADSAEMARELEDREVVDALGNEATIEIARISAALQRIDAGDFGLCLDCGEQIAFDRLAATPYVERCIDCANEAERIQA